MNVADSLAYARVLEGLGCVLGESEESSDILVINTCSVRAKAEEKAISYLGSVIRRRAAHQARHGRPAVGGIAFVGCMATVRGEEIKRRFPGLRVVLPASELDKFEEGVAAAWPGLVASPAGMRTEPLLRPEERFERFVPIVRGCANRCTYCIVPRARADRITSRSPDLIFREVEGLIGAGVRSITLLGQNVCAYGAEIGGEGESPAGRLGIREGYGFADLLSDLRDRFGEKDIWFKFLTSHPRDVTDELVEVIGGHACFSRHFHLPLQAGDDSVLRRMGRGYTSEYYLELVERIRSRLPDMRLTTDLIVGFPGEDEAAFERTMEMVRRIRFDAAFTFLYSLRPGTPAEKLADPVPRDEKKRRLQALIDLQNRITLERASERLGEERPVLVEGPALSRRGREQGLVAGRTREEEVVMFPGGEEDYGRRIAVRLVEANLRSFGGERAPGGGAG
jgi:tRNA-2-methylthio-N6-dimethylallyladenosine synthase